MPMIPVKEAMKGVAIAELSCLFKGILTCCSVQNYERLNICLRIIPCDDPSHLCKLVHEILLVVKSSRCINEKDIRISCLGGSHCVVYNCSGISALIV